MILFRDGLDAAVTRREGTEVMIGRTVSQYRIVEKVGEGGKGVVYKAQDMRLGRFAALKFLSPDHLNEEERQRFLREAQAASALDHPNICTIYDIGDGDAHGNGTFIAMPFYDGETLNRRIARGPLTPEDALDVAIAVTRALERAHEAGIVHRDVKPGNVMLTSRGDVKLLDFGAAKVFDQPDLTLEGEALGTPGYMSPEQVLGHRADARQDLWGLGILLYEMLTGVHPFAAEPNKMAMFYAIAHKNAPSLAEARDDVPPELVELVDALLARDPAERPSTARGVLGALLQLRQESTGMPMALFPDLGSRALVAPPPEAAAGRLRRRALWMAALGALLVTVAVWRAGHGEAEPEEEALTSVAVLPFVNLSRDPGRDHLADGMTEALINDLARLDDLRVISRTSVMSTKALDKTLPEIARELGVDYVVEGSVLEVDDQVRITVQLIDAARDRNLWAESYERPLVDVLDLQREVAEDVTARIDGKLGGRGAKLPRTF